MRVPPSVTYPATTPAWRRLTSSRNAGGNDHSRPTSRPTFRGMNPPRGFAAARGETGSVVAADVQRQHLLPVRPIVRPTVPDPQRVPDPLVPELVRQAF